MSRLTTILGRVRAAGARLRRRQHDPSGAIRLVTSRYLGGKRFLTLVEVDGERLLLGLAGDQVSLVARLGTPSPAPPAPAAGETPERR